MQLAWISTVNDSPKWTWEGASEPNLWVEPADDNLWGEHPIASHDGAAYCWTEKVLQLHSKFPDTFWSFKHALKSIRKRAVLPPLGQLTLAAMLPGEWAKRLVEVNVRKRREKDLAWADGFGDVETEPSYFRIASVARVRL